MSVKRKVYEKFVEEDVEFHQEVLKMAKAFCDKECVKVKTKLLKGNPADAIISFLEKEPHDIVVMGSRGLGGFKRLLMGSTSSSVIEHCKHSVLVVK